MNKFRFTVVDSNTDRLLGYFYDHPQCGEDFCATCGDCLYCYDDSTCTGGAHDWSKYVNGIDGAKRMCAEREVRFIPVESYKWLDFAMDGVLCRIESRGNILMRWQQLKPEAFETVKPTYLLLEACDVGRLRTTLDVISESGFKTDGLLSATLLLDDAWQILLDGDIERYYTVMHSVAAELNPEHW